MTRQDCLERTKDILDERDTTHGRAEDNFSLCAQLWNETFGTNFSMEDVALALMLLKVSRIYSSEEPNQDNYIDICGYAALACEMATEDWGDKKETVEAARKKGKPILYSFSKAREKLQSAFVDYYYRSEGIDFYDMEQANIYATKLLQQAKRDLAADVFPEVTVIRIYKLCVKAFPFKNASHCGSVEPVSTNEVEKKIRSFEYENRIGDSERLGTKGSDTDGDPH